MMGIGRTARLVGLLALLCMRTATGEEANAPTDAAVGVQTALELPGYAPAVVWVPPGTSSDKAPVVLATHGAYDNPENYCQFWERIVGSRAFIVCTRGVRIREGEYYYPNHFFIDGEEQAAAQALRDHFGARVAEGPPIYAGYSQGAIHGAPLLRMRPESHPVAVFIEGGGDWSTASAERYRRCGGKRILFVCGTTGCRDSTRGAAQLLARAGVETKTLWVPSAGHNYPAEMAERIGNVLPWLVGDDPLWFR